mmetsp:Transcript_27543/g.73126  ORF Transcript_27543/g.73126 Transcript_27543/m.73126 type:complete len:215 (-) Transcript_27543:689-1333(-)
MVACRRRCHLPETTKRRASGTALDSHSVTILVYKLSTVSSMATCVLSCVTMGLFAAPGTCWYTVQPVMQTPCSSAALAGSAPTICRVRDARTTRSLPSHLVQKSSPRRATSKSSRATTNSAPLRSTSASSRRPSSPPSPSSSAPPPLPSSRQATARPTACACCKSLLPGRQPTTATTSAGKAATSCASSSPRSGVDAAPPPTTQMRVRVTRCLS